MAEEPVRPAQAADPVAAVIAAHAASTPLALTTSGTSGTARTVVRTTASWWDSFDAYADLSGVGPGARLWLPGPLRSTMNLFAAVHARVAGATVVEDPAAATHACLTPTALDRRGGELARGTRVVVAGAALAPGLYERAVAAGLAVRSYYGAAELSFVGCGPHAEDLHAFPGVTVEIRDGVIWVASPYLSLGLGPWATVGDLGRLDGERLIVLGRPGTVTTAGATVALAEVEAALRRAARGQVAVVGLPHPGLGEVVAAAFTAPEDAETLRRVARDQLPATHRPRIWRRLDALPTTAGGKVDDAAVRALLDGSR
jgi:acyl-coenzyme A synthetase/AMP-(fatty) acid ligase